jgi:hypothetical protein
LPNPASVEDAGASGSREPRSTRGRVPRARAMDVTVRVGPERTAPLRAGRNGGTGGSPRRSSTPGRNRWPPFLRAWRTRNLAICRALPKPHHPGPEFRCQRGVNRAARWRGRVFRLGEADDAKPARSRTGTSAAQRTRSLLRRHDLAASNGLEDRCPSMCRRLLAGASGHQLAVAFHARAR